MQSFPGGDPGDNHPRHVMPFLADLSVILKIYHPSAKIWMSLQGFNEKEINYFFDWIVEHKPDWFGGAVGGPASPPLPYIRGRLPGKYKLRDYPDITHTVRSQYPTPWLDPAIAFTSGREGTNPEPVYYSTIFRHNQEFIDGFITYSDGIHDDVNKIVYSMLGWDKDLQPYSIILDYVRFFFGVQIVFSILKKIGTGLYKIIQTYSQHFKLLKHLANQNQNFKTTGGGNYYNSKHITMLT